MSGVCGAWSVGGDRIDLGPALSILERRGPEKTRHWNDGEVSLGHTLLATTPEALVENLPCTDPGSGCTVTADARIDNRDELIALLGLSNGTRVIGDGALILRAYIQWGEDCPSHLLGDFAFAIWDPRVRKMFCARDHMGMRQLVYHSHPRVFAFATETEALLALQKVPRRINDGRIADYLDDLEGFDFTSTFFEDVFRLPPAHCLTISDQGLSLRRYWELLPGPQLRLESDEQYAQAFLEVFTEAVRCRLRSTGSIGAMLSGGMDSSSVVAVASRLLASEGAGPLKTFSAVGPDPDTCIETRSIECALTIAGLDPVKIDYSSLDDSLEDLIRLTREASEPFDQMTLVRAVNLAAHRAGVNVLLDGVGGDVALTASNRIADYLRHFRFRAAWREALAEQHFWEIPGYAVRNIVEAAWCWLIPSPIRKLRHHIIWLAKTHLAGRPRLMSANLARKVNRHGRWRKFRSHISYAHLTDAEQRAQAIRHPHLTVGRERYDREASQLAIEPRDPFLDIRLLQFCLSLPSSVLQNQGWPKLLLRHAMEGMLPNQIIWRRGRAHLGWHFKQWLFASWPDWKAELESASQMSGYLSSNEIQRLKMTHDGSPWNSQDLIDAFYLRLFHASTVIGRSLRSPR